MDKHECMYVECNEQTSNPKYCSLSCGTKQQFINKPAKARYKTCPECEEDFRIGAGFKSPENVYCSHSCAAKVSNLKRWNGGVKFERPGCARCGRMVSDHKRKYCSRECSSRHKSELIVEEWLDGKSSGTVASGLVRTIRNYLLEQAEYKCQSPTCCVEGGWSVVNQSTGKVPLEIDHIDGNCYNNSPENLIVLCPNCHAITPTYRALNKNSGRHYRRQRYAKGKSH